MDSGGVPESIEVLGRGGFFGADLLIDEPAFL
jgi:hypothetical protein